MKQLGLIGVGADGTLYTPNGAKLFRVPLCVACGIQKAWTWLAKRTWK